VFQRSRQGDADWPGTHHLWITADGKDEAFTYYERLAAANVHVNYRELPYGLGYGLRLGTSFSSVAGVGTQHVDELAAIVESAMSGGSGEALRRRVRELAQDAASEAIVPTNLWR